jgi:hypothetical protein
MDDDKATSGNLSYDMVCSGLDAYLEDMDRQAAEYSAILPLWRTAVRAAPRGVDYYFGVFQQLLFDMAHGMGLILSEQQSDVLRHMMHALIPHIYGGLFTTHKQRIMSIHRVTRIVRHVLITTPRQVGKTTLLAMLIAACLYRMRGIKIGLFAGSKDQGVELKNRVVGFLYKLAGDEPVALLRSSRHLIIIDHSGVGERREAAGDARLAGNCSLEIAAANDTISFLYFYCSTQDPGGAWPRFGGGGLCLSPLRVTHGHAPPSPAAPRYVRGGTNPPPPRRAAGHAARSYRPSRLPLLLLGVAYLGAGRG